MPLNKKGKEIMSNMKSEYGPGKKAEQVFYASRNAGKIKGVEGKRTPHTFKGHTARNDRS